MFFHISSCSAIYPKLLEASLCKRFIAVSVFRFICQRVTVFLQHEVEFNLVFYFLYRLIHTLFRVFSASVK